MTQVGEPVVVNVHEILEATKQLLGVKCWHVQMIAGIMETLQIVLRPERLGLTTPSILHNRDAFKRRNTVVQASSGGINTNWLIRCNTWLTPATGEVPINLEHVITESLAESVCRVVCRPVFTIFSFSDCQVFRL